MADVRVNQDIVIPEEELKLNFSSSGGPGGQNVNKVESKVELRWNPSKSAVLSEEQRQRVQERLASRLTNNGEIIVTSSVTRDQIRNREDAENKLGELIAAALVIPKKRTPTKPRRGAVEQRLKTKKHRSNLKRERQTDSD